MEKEEITEVSRCSRCGSELWKHVSRGREWLYQCNGCGLEKTP